MTSSTSLLLATTLDWLFVFVSAVAQMRCWPLRTVRVSITWSTQHTGLSLLQLENSSLKSMSYLNQTYHWTGLKSVFYHWTEKHGMSSGKWVRRQVGPVDKEQRIHHSFEGQVRTWLNILFLLTSAGSTFYLSAVQCRWHRWTQDLVTSLFVWLQVQNRKSDHTSNHDAGCDQRSNRHETFTQRGQQNGAFQPDVKLLFNIVYETTWKAHSVLLCAYKLNFIAFALLLNFSYVHPDTPIETEVKIVKLLDDLFLLKVSFYKVSPQPSLWVVIWQAPCCYQEMQLEDYVGVAFVWYPTND